MPIIKIEDIEFVRFSAPDLEVMRLFLLDFGFLDVEAKEPGILRMRGSGDSPFVHETVIGEPGFAGVAFRASSVEDLERLAQSEGVSLAPAGGPGGGMVARLQDPNGFQVDVIAGKARATPVPIANRVPWNEAASRGRTGEPKRIEAGPANVVRLGHVVLRVTDMARSWTWWQDRFGLIMSDEVRAPNGDLAAAFVRCDRGATPVDHHTINFATMPGLPAGFHHAAFEVADLDDLMAGSMLLEAKGYRHDWGIGRHVLGSQVFDYWRDPWGNRVEHWTDGDFFDASIPPSVTDIPTMLSHQWGPAAPADFAV